ncbi:hypothetical protein [Streptomyces canus]|uniref:hypothetical protein n=1 Tax=Streptomyces canus TaxID=58343 RepID=UPI0036ED062B
MTPVDDRALARLTAAPSIDGVMGTLLRRTGQETIHDQARDRAESPNRDSSERS